MGMLQLTRCGSYKTAAVCTFKKSGARYAKIYLRFTTSSLSHRGELRAELNELWREKAISHAVQN
jgi:hypothetical protein